MPNNEVWAIVQVYAPTENYKDEEMVEFYDTLQTALVNYNNLIVMGDFNAQIGKVQTGEERVFGHFSYGKRSKHGIKLVEFAMEHDLRFVNSIFKRKPHQKWTWNSPGDKYFNEIDYIITNKSYYIISLDIIQNLNFNTDHRMIRCKLNLDCKIKKVRKRLMASTNRNLKNVLTVTNDNGKNLEETFLSAVTEMSDVQTQYNKLVKQIQNAAKVTGNMKPEKPLQTSKHTYQLLTKRKAMYKLKRTRKIKEEITRISKEINKSIYADKKLHRKKIYEQFIEKSGAIRKANKVLRTKTVWATNINNRKGKPLIKRPDMGSNQLL
ncbi:jg4223 [Pararge aegeria aegeria]|uniref:Jg4223 protein n=1 Tax=Pararge aegeria aegeria TaxID=348720 RepID=A0A8S4R4T1_9NEOP|nr:jg4223 [Pararge aegeria aegeria]